MLTDHPIQKPTEHPLSVSEQQTKVSSLENRTIYLEQNLALLSAKFERFQIASIATEKINEKQDSGRSDTIVYVCSLCDEEHNKKDNLNEHIRIAHTIKNNDHLRCIQCSYIAIHEKDLRRHVWQMHSPDDDEIMYCNACDFSTQYESNLNEHIENTHKFRTRYFHSNSRLRNRRVTQNLPTIHMKAPSKAHAMNRDSSEKCSMVDTLTADTHNSGLKCNKCNKWFTCEDEFKLHMEYYHSDTQQ